MQDELLPEYDLKKLRLRKVGPGRKYFAGKPVNQLNFRCHQRICRHFICEKGL